MRYLFALLIAAQLIGCDRQPSSRLAQVLDRGELVVATRNGPTTYYLGPQGEAGLEYELVKRFADHLSVDVRLVVPGRFDSILPLVRTGEVDLAAAGLVVTQDRITEVRFGPIYQETIQQVVYRRGNYRPRDFSDLSRGTLEVVAGSSHAERLRRMGSAQPEFDWRENPELDNEELMYLVWREMLDYTVVDSHELAITRRYYPELGVAFDLGEPQPLAWAFAPGADDSLYRKAVEFFNEMKDTGVLAQLQERYYGHVDDYDYVGTRVYLRHMEERLPSFLALFQEAASRYGWDWRLLAALSYQESHWNPRARSPTGVRGLMMLTLNTAEQVNIDNRLDPRQSVMGGARYLMRVKQRVPERIQEPDRTWMALAAYNVGYGHLNDARILAEADGKDPDRWVDVKEYLPLLSQKKWHSRTKHGYARGHEPVQYVENIRTYYDLLVWAQRRDRLNQQPGPQPAEADARPASL